MDASDRARLIDRLERKQLLLARHVDDAERELREAEDLLDGFPYTLGQIALLTDPELEDACDDYC